MTTDWTTNTEVRAFNGQCEYGPWLDVFHEDVPSWVEGLIADEIAEDGADNGTVSRGGSMWRWRKRA